MSETALDRTARALDLVPYLLEHQGISISELSEVFGVSEKQINEDLMLIHMCGLPGYTPLELIEMYYEDGYVTVSDPQSLNRPRRMSRSEFTALLVSLDLMKSLRSDSLVEEIEILESKLRKGIDLENPVVVIASTKNNPDVSKIEMAISRANVLKIQYASGIKDESSTREILPLEIYHSNNASYLNAWCLSSLGDRTFRLDRILSCEILEGRTISQPEMAEETFEDNQLIELKVSKSARAFIEENRSIIESVEDGSSITAKVHSIDREWLIRTILGFGNQIEVVHPQELADEISNRARDIRAMY